MLTNISFSQYIVGQLRKAIVSGDLIDYNSLSRNGDNFIYPDHPMIQILMKNKNNFPRISIESMNTPTLEDIGIGCTEQVQTANLKITVFSVRDLICSINTVTDESHTYITGTNIYELNELPLSDITNVTGTLLGSPYIFIKNVDFIVYDSDFDGFRDSIIWLADIPDNGTDFLVSYKRNATSQEICRIIAQDIHVYLRDNWRFWSDRKFWGYKLTNSMPVDFDENIGVSRYEISISFEGINIGEEI